MIKSSVFLLVARLKNNVLHARAWSKNCQAMLAFISSLTVVLCD